MDNPRVVLPEITQASAALHIIVGGSSKSHAFTVTRVVQESTIIIRGTEQVFRPVIAARCPLIVAV